MPVHKKKAPPAHKKKAPGTEACMLHDGLCISAPAHHNTFARLSAVSVRHGWCPCGPRSVGHALVSGPSQAPLTLVACLPSAAPEKKRDDSRTPDSSDIDDSEFSDEQEDEEDYRRGGWTALLLARGSAAPERSCSTAATAKRCTL